MAEDSSEIILERVDKKLSELLKKMMDKLARGEPLGDEDAEQMRQITSMKMMLFLASPSRTPRLPALPSGVTAFKPVHSYRIYDAGDCYVIFIDIPKELFKP